MPRTISIVKSWHNLSKTFDVHPHISQSRIIYTLIWLDQSCESCMPPIDMLCKHCFRALARPLSEGPVSRRYKAITSRQTTPSRRSLSSTSSSRATTLPNAATQSAPRQGDPSSSHNPPAATSTSAAQPFSSPMTYSGTSQVKAGVIPLSLIHI